MQFQFDAHQEFQVRAVASVADVFRGLRLDAVGGQFDTILGARVARGDEARFTLDHARLLENVRRVQRHNGVPESDGLRLLTETAEIDGVQQAVAFPNVSVEMETGTGKTYVYFRTAFELYRQYGLGRFVIVVPSVAVREGVVKTFEVTRGHFARLYDNPPARCDVYEGRSLNKVSQFAHGSGVQFLVMTVDSFNKEQNVIRQRRDRVGPTPLELLQAARPVLILDEPQNLESAKSKQALAALNPLIALRYSATHRDSYNLVYRLTPYEAYRQGLVKRIEVAPVVTADDFNSAYVRLVGTASTSKAVVCKLAVQQRMADGRIKEKAYTFRPDDTLADRANRSEYATFVVDTIDVAARTVSFKNGVTVKEGRPHGADAAAVFREQIRYTVEQHFRRQEQLRDKGVKVLSLFFLDRVDNYAAADGVVRRLFDEAFDELKAKYPAWQRYTPDRVRAAYFAAKKRKGGGVEFQDSAGGENAEDRAAYALIMRDKEKLLSFTEPTAFIFSHSALKEGWDNPNVFQICTLNQTASEVKKRQEIGRGLRLAVDQAGTRRREEGVNVLTVVANESYESFVAGLQGELAAEYGDAEAAKLRVSNARAKSAATRKPMEHLPTAFRELWDAISRTTRYRVTVDTAKLVADVVAAMNELTVSPPRVVVTRARLDVQQDGRGGQAFVALQMSGAKTLAALDGRFPLPDLVGKIAEQLAHVKPPMRVSRRTLLAVVAGVKPELQQAAVENPEGFAAVAANVVREKLDEQLVQGIRYEPDGGAYDQERFEPTVETVTQMAEARKSLYDRLAVDSEVERKFAEKLEAADGVKFYLKLPRWFTVPTPLGTYNPDWAFVWQDADEFGDGGPRLVLVRETKGSTAAADLRVEEQRKIHCGSRHHEALGIDYQVMTAADPLPGGTPGLLGP
jgi:type III restriction enzyme